MAEFTIITYGGGEILNKIFNSIAMLMNGADGSLFQPLMIMGGSIGAVWAITRTFFNASKEYLIGKYLIPLVAISSLLLVPTATVRIEDPVVGKPINSVDNVPYGLAVFSQVVSTIGHSLTQAIEVAMHTPEDRMYSKTGQIFGADTALEASQYVINDGFFDQNMQSFVSQCVFYDLALGKYAINDLKKSTDIWGFLSNNTSKVRGIMYCDGKESSAVPATSTPRQCTYKSCQEAMKMMQPYFEKEKEYYKNHAILGNLPLTYQAITGISQTPDQLIGQQVMMQAILGDPNAQTNFAKNRAYTQQRQTYHILGSLASKSLLTMRNVLEALIYASFIFIMPMVLFPGGYKFLGVWAGLVVWLQLWPPFFAILSYIMQTVAQSKAATIVSSIGSSGELCIMTSIGLKNLQEDMFALAGYLAASIPFISYAILKGGVSSFVHLASSIMSPAHSASSAAAAEQATGNYSFGNVSLGNLQHMNTSAFQRQMAPTLSSGYMTENAGTHTTTHTGEGVRVRENKSDLIKSLASDEVTQASVQNTHQNALSYSESQGELFSNNAAHHSKQVASLAEHMAHNDQFSDSLSQRDGVSMQDSARELENMAGSWGKQFGLDERTSLGVLGSAHVSAGIGVRAGPVPLKLGADVSGKLARDVTDSQVMSSATNFAQSDEFSSLFQSVQDYSKSAQATTLNDEGVRLAQDVSTSYDATQSSQQTYQASINDLEQISEVKSWVESNSDVIRTSLDTDFLTWASDKYVDKGGHHKALEVISDRSSPDSDALYFEYLNHLHSESPRTQSPTLDFAEGKSAYETNLSDYSNSAEEKLGALSNQDHYLERSHGLQKEELLHSQAGEHLGEVAPANSRRILQGHVDKQNQGVDERVSQKSTRINSEGERFKQEYGYEKERGKGYRLTGLRKNPYASSAPPEFFPEEEP